MQPELASAVGDPDPKVGSSAEESAVHTGAQTPKAAHAATRPQASTGRGRWVSSVDYATGFLRGLPRRRTSGAQK